MEITPCTRFKLNTYFPITLASDDDIQISGTRIIQILNDMLNKTEKIPYILYIYILFIEILKIVHQHSLTDYLHY